MKLSRYSLAAAALVLASILPVRAQGDPEPFFTTKELPDLIRSLPAPPDTLSAAFTYDIMRYMWGKTQRPDSARAAMAWTRCSKTASR